MGKKNTVVLLNGLILPIGGVALGTVCVQPANTAYLREEEKNTFFVCRGPLTNDVIGQREGMGVGQKIIFRDERGGGLGKNIFS